MSFTPHSICIDTATAAEFAGDALVIGLFSDDGSSGFSDAFAAINEASGGWLARRVEAGDIAGGAGRLRTFYELQGVQAERVVVVGLGSRAEYGRKAIDKAAAALRAPLTRTKLEKVAIALPAPHEGVATLVDASVLAISRASYKFDQCKGKNKPAAADTNPAAWHILVASDQQEAAQSALQRAQGTALGMALCKDLGNLPGNICTPTYLAEQAEQLAKDYSALTTEVLEEADMAELGMGSLLSVSRGSRQPAKFIIMQYRNGPEGGKPIVLVGKGLTFDAGGISIKPGAGMDEMKYDMCGGATVFGVTKAIVEMQLPINFVAVVPASENLPDGDANKPGDIVTSMSGQTIEILNTDAEGRLILCDALTYVERFDPELVIDMATLTGAIIVALGKIPTGLFTEDRELENALRDAGDSVNDRVWPMPMWDDYQALLKSNFADMANIGGRDGGSITAACFLKRYTKKYRWAHLDIAGTAWISGGNKGATGRPVPLLVEFLTKQV